MRRLGNTLSPAPFFLHFAVFGVLSGSLARSWRQMWLAVIGVNVFYAIQYINELSPARWPLLTLRQALELVATDQAMYVLLGGQLFASAGCAIVIFWLRQVLTKKTQ